MSGLPGCPCSICEDADRTAGESDSDDSQGLDRSDRTIRSAEKLGLKGDGR